MRGWPVAGTVAAPALVAGAALALLAGCGSGPGRPGSPPARPDVVARAEAAASPSPDRFAANTQQVCGAINQAVARGAATFGTDAGSMIGHLAGGNRSAADAAARSAVRELTALAGRVRAATAPALNPAVHTAGEDTASNLDRAAADPGLLSGVKTITDLSPVLDRITSTADPLTRVCV